MKLEVGKTYKNRDGEVVMIVKYEEAEDFYRCKYRTYTPYGSYYTNGESSYDLIEEVVPAIAYRVKAEQTDNRDFVKSMEGEKGKVYTEFKLIPSYHEKFINMGGWSYYATQVDAGYIDPITGEFVMNENESKKLKLEVGKTYKTRGGEIVKIVSAEGWDQYKFRDNNRWTYTEDGLRYDWVPDHEYNIVEEVESKKPKLKLEVGKTYRDGYGDLHTIVSNKSNLGYPEHTFWSDERSYTVEGFWQMEKKAHKYNLVEEVEVETKTTNKKEQPKMKYYRVTKKNTEANKDFPVGSIVTLYKDDGTWQPEYRNVNTSKTRYLVTAKLEEINVKTVKTVISPASKLVKILEDSGYKVGEDGQWRHPDKETFISEMFYFCGEELTNRWRWLPEWLEEKIVFDSTVNTFNARQFIVDFMKKKRELSHEAYLYQRDIDEIENEWSDEECEKVAGRILRHVEKDFNSSCCPFCIKFYGFCDNCSYGKRHGICSKDGSDFQKYIHPAVYGKVWPELLDFVDNYPGARK